jgi:hypothetical protein
LSFILNAASPSRAIPSSSVFGSPSSTRQTTSEASSASEAPTEWNTLVVGRGADGT